MLIYFARTIEKKIYYLVKTWFFWEHSFFFYFDSYQACSKDYLEALNRRANPQLRKRNESNRTWMPILHPRRQWWRSNQRWTTCRKSEIRVSLLFRIERNQKEADAAFARAKEIRAKNPDNKQDPGIRWYSKFYFSSISGIGESEEMPWANYSVYCTMLDEFWWE